MSLSHELNPSILWDEKLAQLVQQSVLEMVFILFKLSCYFILQLLIYLSKIDITHVLFLINFMSDENDYLFFIIIYNNKKINVEFFFLI